MALVPSKVDQAKNRRRLMDLRMLPPRLKRRPPLPAAFFLFADPWFPNRTKQ
jgi:hypothetical protein